MPALRLTESKRRTVTQDEEQQEARREAGNVFKLSGGGKENTRSLFRIENVDFCKRIWHGKLTENQFKCFVIQIFWVEA